VYPSFTYYSKLRLHHVIHIPLLWCSANVSVCLRSVCRARLPGAMGLALSGIRHRTTFCTTVSPTASPTTCAATTAFKLSLRAAVATPRGTTRSVTRRRPPFALSRRRRWPRLSATIRWPRSHVRRTNKVWTSWALATDAPVTLSLVRTTLTVRVGAVQFRVETRYFRMIRVLAELCGALWQTC